jgi:pimeloyl-ACP methyl ester carboxylesterase
MVGCASDPEAEKFGKTFYLDGAGNWGFGASDVPQGLRDAGYRGDVEIYIWTTSLTPIIDQLNIPAAKLRALALAHRIKKYFKEHPDNKLNIVALSAGTGVAVWAVEALDDKTKVNNLILLGSSLSHDYNVSKALEHMSGNIYVYHSPHDVVLAGVRFLGTIDGKRGVDSAGLVGLKTPRGMKGRVKNIPWSRKYIPYGWTGSHTDCTTRRFVRTVLARHVVGTNRGAAGGSTEAARVDTAERAESADGEGDQSRTLTSH